MATFRMWIGSSTFPFRVLECTWEEKADEQTYVGFTTKGCKCMAMVELLVAIGKQ
jgi:hypothetical protein